MKSISVVILTWERDAVLLHNSLHTLNGQTILPLEIVVADINHQGDWAEKNSEVVAQYPLARLVKCPRPQGFNLSFGMNVGIRATSERADYVMPTCSEFLFSPTVIEAVLDEASEGTIVTGPCGFLQKGIEVDYRTAWDEWDELITHISPSPPIPSSTGTYICIRRQWWFDVRGYDEIGRPFAYADSDVSLRAKRSGMQEGHVKWDEGGQLLHPWHKPSPLVYSCGGTLPTTDEPIVRNPKEWGGAA